MKISAQKSDILSFKGDLIAAGLHDGKIATDTPLGAIDKKLKGEIAELIKKENFKGAPGQAKLIYVKGRLTPSYVLIVGLGDAKKFTLDVARKCGASIQSAARQVGAHSAAAEIAGAGLNGLSAAECAQAITEGALLNSYAFSRYKKQEPAALKSLALIVGEKTSVLAIGKAVTTAELLAEGVCLARDMINTPASDMTPKTLADQAKKSRGVTTRVHDLNAIRRMKMGSFLSVAQGSTKNPPYFIEMHYRPKGKAKKRVAIIGKGVTFDTGGYSIKPAKSMETMKDDMSGAAAVISVMSIISRLSPDVEVSAYVAATENMVDGFAQRPGDICTAMDGTTIEVLNTDAEGRLTLADAILYAKKNKPDYVIDMATLTGACMVSLGLLYSGIMGNDDELVAKLIDSGKQSGENIWRLPLPEEYKEEIKSPVADLKNVGGAWGGTLTAGLFLEHFAAGTKWAHIDVAGPAWTDKPLPYTPRGGTGIMVRTIARFLSGF